MLGIRLIPVGQFLMRKFKRDKINSLRCTFGKIIIIKTLELH